MIEIEHKQEGITLFREEGSLIALKKPIDDPYVYYDILNKHMNKDINSPGRCWFRSRFPEIAKIHGI